MPVQEIPHRNGPGRAVWILVLLFVLVLGARTIAGYVLEYQWWKEVGQLQTWTSLILYGILPVAFATFAGFAILWIAHARALKHAGTRLRRHRAYAWISSLVLLVLAWMIASISIDGWTVVRYVGARAMPSPETWWADPVFGKRLPFYFFELPFYRDLIGLVLALSLAAALVYWLTARGWQLKEQLPRFRDGSMVEFDLVRDLRLYGALESRFLRGAVALFLLALAAQFFFGRYNLLYEDHGFMAGIEYVDENIRLPLIWLVTAGSVIAAALVLFGKWKALFIPVVLLLAQAIVPALVSQFYVKPNELALQRPYIVKHIEATRAAYDLAEQLREVQYPAQLETKIDVAGNQSLIENVRLWDWRAFHDTVTQIQALRQYYVFHDTDVDRYVLDGELRQVMLTPRELDISQLADATANWINGHFIYTHGYGLVMAEAAKITPNGQPVLIIQDAPPKVNTKSLQLTRPEIYFGEVTHEPVFVRTQQPEFNYPAGSDIVQTRYEGKGGIPVASFGMRLMTAIAYGDRNILLTSLLTPESRMLIRRNIRERLQELAGFIRWDTDPYLVVNGEGRMVWMVDGLTTSRHHPYSRLIRHQDLGVLNYVRNSVKATVDAYDGTVRMYVFDEGDPVLRAWRTIFPSLFLPESSMPADLRAHARYSEPMFRTQSEIYRTYHMTDPESFYNREDVWDIARNVHGPGGKPDTATPTFIVATLPGETEPEYLLLLPFTPRNKDNLIGLMAARCDGEKLGEIVVLQLSKQSLIYGPLQIEARIDSDQVIAKDLSLWNQQGSQVLRGQMLVLPVDESFIYVEPIYIQSAQARMPQLKKVVVAVGNNLIYRDTYEQAIAELAGTALPPETSLKAADTPPQTAGAAPPAPPAGDPRIESIRNHLRRYRELVSQGKWSEAGRELEALENEVNRR